MSGSCDLLLGLALRYRRKLCLALQFVNIGVMTGKVEISALHVHRYAGGRFEFTAFAAGDECPRDCDAKRGPAGGWLFTARRSDLTEADWKQIEHLIESTPGE